MSFGSPVRITVTGLTSHGSGVSESSCFVLLRWSGGPLGLVTPPNPNLDSLARYPELQPPFSPGRAMVSVASLLNPVAANSYDYRQLPSPCSSKYDYAYATVCNSPPPPPPPAPFKKQKMTKDAAIFAKGKAKGQIRYPPCEIQDDEVAVQHRRFQVYPMGHITDYCRHIPYNSEKKSFLEKTGRESFEGAYGRSREVRAIRGGRLQLIHIPRSLPVHVQSPRRRSRVYRHVGLQRRSRSHHALLQMLQVLQGENLSSEFLLCRGSTSTHTDHASEDAEQQPWAPRNLPQHYWRSTGSSR